MRLRSSIEAAAAAFACLVTIACNAQELEGRWQLRITDAAQQTRVEATIRFTQEAAKSCMDGTWKRAVVDKVSTSDERFYPLAEALAYELKDGQLTLGRTSLCDGYLFMTGPLAPAAIEGRYYAFGLAGQQPLGAFTLKKAE